ncbi:hypothetical protein [Mycobacterium sp. OTB74]|uniref:hypothetical protein n=1 Tax=Mycobacterium sp. OTB74 TaxID=1853452 RepID=UPI002475EB87|nr:hypothetical protein [Mycobacterium sp. OTB74]MDH6245485.1 hypothetical protein [Mycobacterium sp. OTB74]
MSMAPTAEQWARQQGWEAAMATATCLCQAQIDLLTVQRNRLRDEVDRIGSELDDRSDAGDHVIGHRLDASDRVPDNGQGRIECCRVRRLRGRCP